MITKKDKKYLFVWVLSSLGTLIIHYFLISKINVNSTIQVFIDFMIFFVATWIISKMFSLTKKKTIKRKKVEWKYYLVFLMIIPVLIIHYFLISKINVNSTIQVFIDLVIFLFILTILVLIMEWPEKRKNKKKK